MAESGTAMTRSASAGCSRARRAAHLEARLVQQAPVDDAVGPGEVDELEHAQPLALRGGLRWSGTSATPSSSMVSTSPASTSRTKLRAHRVERRALAERPPSRRSAAAPAPAGRKPTGSRGDDERVGGEHGEGVGAGGAVEGVVDALRPGSARRVRDQLGQHLGVGGGCELDPLLGQLVAQPACVGEVAVVAEHELAAIGLGVHRLHVRQRVRAGRAVARVADGRLRRARRGRRRPRGGASVSSSKTPLTRPSRLWRLSCAAVADRDAGRLLAAVLERVKPDVGQARDRRAGRPDADDSALLARAVGLVDGQRVADPVRQLDGRAHGSGQAARCGPGTCAIIAAAPGAPAPACARRTEVRAEYCTHPHQGRFRRRYRVCRPATRDHRPMAAAGPGAIILSAMLSFVRALGFLAPLAVGGVRDRRPRRRRVPSRPTERSALVVVLAVSAAAGMTTMALIAWSYFGWRLSRLARALERTLDADGPNGPAARSASRPSAAWPEPSTPPPAPSCRPRRAQPTTASPAFRTARPCSPRSRSEVERAGAPLQAAQRRLHRHRPLQADQRHLRPQLRRRSPAPDRRPHRRLGARERHIRPLRRRGVHAHPARDHARGCRRAGRGAARTWSSTSRCASRASRPSRPRSASASPAAAAPSSSSTCWSTAPMRPCTPPSRSAATARTSTASSTTRRRCAARRSRPSTGRRRPPSANGPATRPPRPWHRSWRRSRITAADRRT